MLLKEIGAFVAAQIAEHPEYADMEVKFGFWPAMHEGEEPHLELEVVKYLKIKIVGEYRHQISHERKQQQHNEKNSKHHNRR